MATDMPNKVLFNKYLEVETKINDKTSVWHYFLRSEDKKLAKCKNPMCEAIVKAAGGSTSGCQTHLRTKHNIDLKKLKEEANPKETEENARAGACERKKIDGYFTVKKKKELDEVVATMIAKDGLTFRVFEKSSELRESLQARGYVLPKTAKAFKSMTIKYSKKIRQNQKKVIKELVAKGERFCVTFDEWTSLRNIRFINLILHGRNSEIWNLGMIRIRRNLSSERCLSYVSKRLKDFDLSMADHIVCIFTDGTSVMTKIAKIGPAYQQLCFAHGIQLAVIDVLYKKEKKKGVVENAAASNVAVEHEDSEESEESDSDVEDEAESDSDGEDEAGNVQIEEDEPQITSDDDEPDDFEGFGADDDSSNVKNLDLNEYVKPIILKVRKIVKVFRRSPKKNEVLQRYVKREHKNEHQLILDCKTRWSSLANMIIRFYDCRNSIKKALVDIESKDVLEEWEIELLLDIKNALEPIQAAVEALCRRDASLITADATIIFTLKSLKKQGSRLSLQLFEAIKRRVKERRTILSSVLQFLHANSDSAINDSDLDASWSSEVADMFQTPSRIKIETVIKEMVHRLHVVNDHEEEEVPVPEKDEPIKNPKKKKNKTVLHEELDKAIEKALASNYEEKVKTDKASMAKVIKQELSLFQNVGTRGFYLTKVYNLLLLIKPTSVESERAFSSAGYFCNKIRSRMNDDTLDHLCSLRSYFQKIGKN